VTNPNVTNPNVTNPNVTNSNLVNPNVTNPNVTNPNVTNPNVTNADLANPNVTNPNVTNPNVTNPNVTNPNVTNSDPSNPNVTNQSVSDAVYEVTNEGNTAASYRVALVGNAPAGVTTQLIITKTYKTPAVLDCQLFEQGQELLLANILNPVFSPPGSNLTDPSIFDPGIGNPTVALRPNESAPVRCGPSTDPRRSPRSSRTRCPSSCRGGQHQQPDEHADRRRARRYDDRSEHRSDPDPSLPDGVVGVPYSAKVTATGGSPGWPSTRPERRLPESASTGSARSVAHRRRRGRPRSPSSRSIRLSRSP
jgi:hypothetical protein